MPQFEDLLDSRQVRLAERSLLAACALCLAFMMIELIFGILSHSLAIVADAAHLMTDVGAFALSLFSLSVAQMGVSSSYSYGMQRAEVLGTLVSIFTIWALAGVIVWQGVLRIWETWVCSQIHNSSDPRLILCTSINSVTMIVIGLIGLIINLLIAVVLSVGGGASFVTHTHSHASEPHNHHHSHQEKSSVGSFAVQSAFLHALGDSIQSIGVVLAGGFLYLMNTSSYGSPQVKGSLYNLADPICSILFAIITLFTTRDLFMEIALVLMESTPKSANYHLIITELSALEGVTGVHDLHIWSLTPGQSALSVHLVAEDSRRTLCMAKEVCHRHGIPHTTIQIEHEEHSDQERCHLRCYQSSESS